MTPGICGILVAVSHQIKTDGGLENVEGAGSVRFFFLGQVFHKTGLRELAFVLAKVVPSGGVGLEGVGRDGVGDAEFELLVEGVVRVFQESFSCLRR